MRLRDFPCAAIHQDVGLEGVIVLEAAVVLLYEHVELVARIPGGKSPQDVPLSFTSPYGSIP